MIAATTAERLLLAPRDAARVLSISPATLARMTARRELPAIKVGRLTRYSVEDLRAWISEQKGAGNAV